LTSARKCIIEIKSTGYMTCWVAAMFLPTDYTAPTLNLLSLYLLSSHVFCYNNPHRWSLKHKHSVILIYIQSYPIHYCPYSLPLLAYGLLPITWVTVSWSNTVLIGDSTHPNQTRWDSSIFFTVIATSNFAKMVSLRYVNKVTIQNQKETHTHTHLSSWNPWILSNKGTSSNHGMFLNNDTIK
jgi:hypothetical protein